MKYDEAIAALNGAAADEIRQKLNALGKRETLSEEERNALISETAGLLFSVCKECKDEELFRIEKTGGRFCTLRRRTHCVYREPNNAIHGGSP